MKEFLYILMWIFLFPIMLIYHGIKNKSYSLIASGALVTFLIIISVFDFNIDLPQMDFGQQKSVTSAQKSSKQSGISSSSKSTKNSNISSSSSTNSDSDKKQSNQENEALEDVENIDEFFEGYTFLEVDGGDLSGHRHNNVIVDIGYGDREYFAFTNEYGQLIRVIAEEIVLQDEETEHVTKSGRYYSDEAKVPGVESDTLDEGHVIADSLGGVSNAYNITPQDSTINRYGAQSKMEKAIREAGGCTSFDAIITYPNTTTQIPSHYRYTYTIDGEVYQLAFDNAS